MSEQPGDHADGHRKQGSAEAKRQSYCSRSLLFITHCMSPHDVMVQARGEWWTAEHKRIRAELEKKALAVKDETPIDPKWLCYCIDQVIDENTVIVNETITHGGMIHQYIESNRVAPGTRYESTGPVAHTGLGQGMGIALGVKLADPDKTVIALEGDGTFNYNPVLACLGAAQERESRRLVEWLEGQLTMLFAKVSDEAPS